MNQKKEATMREQEKVVDAVDAADQQQHQEDETSAVADIQEGSEPVSAVADEKEIQSDPLDAELERLRTLADENHQRFLRSQADFDNFRRRARQDKEEFAKYASMKLLEQLLPVIDNLDRALDSVQNSNDSEALSKGVDMIARQLTQVLEQEGLEPIEAVGKPFNPEFHQAIMQVESEEHQEGTVVEEVQRGYMLKDRVLRPSMVKISS